MRTTLAIDADILSAARDLARRDGVTIGRVISDLARQALTGQATHQGAGSTAFHGFRPLPRRGVVVTNEMINSIREDEAI